MREPVMPRPVLAVLTGHMLDSWGFPTALLADLAAGNNGGVVLLLCCCCVALVRTLAAKADLRTSPTLISTRYRYVHDEDVDPRWLGPRDDNCRAAIEAYSVQ